jgi:hypothetical protein
VIIYYGLLGEKTTMDLSNLKKNSYKLIAQMEADNYHISSIDLIKHPGLC